MKKLMRLVFGVVVILSLSIFNSCKDKETGAGEIETTGTTATAEDVPIMTEVDSTGMVNDSNVSGVTSGSMEQVP